MTVSSRDTRRLRHAWIYLLSILLLVPSFWMGFLLDDYIILSKLGGEWHASRHLFTFASGDSEEIAALARDGYYPWWVYDELKIVFFRPLAAALTRGDHALFGSDAAGYHLHSLLWWLATLLAAGLVLRRACPGPVGILALALYALDESHLLPAAWISNRHALVSLAPAFFGLWAHLRWREEGWWPGRVLSPAGFAVGLLGGEMALAALAYLLAYEMFGAAGSLRRRLVGLAPSVALVVVYSLIRSLLGCGVTGSGIYIDPTRDPLGFLREAATRIPTLLSGGIAGFPSDLWIIMPGMRPVLIVVGLASAAALLLLLRWIWLTLGVATRRGVRWLLAGSALSLIPVAATFPSDRLFLVAALGISVVLAAIMYEAWCAWRGRRRWFLVGVGTLLALVHLVLMPLSQLNSQIILITQSRVSLDLARSPELEVPDGESLGAVILTAPDYVVGIYVPVIMDHVGANLFHGWRVLSLAPYDHRITRSGSNTLELEVVGGALMGSIFEGLMRGSEHPLRPGDVLERGLIRIEILEGSTAGPTRVAFHFPGGLDDSSLRFYVWEEDRLRPATLPDVGESMLIKRTLGPVGF